MSVLKNILSLISKDKKEICPKCNIEMDLYGSNPWGYFYNKCECCGYRDDGISDEQTLTIKRNNIIDDILK